MSLLAIFKCMFRIDGWICANEGLLSSLSSSYTGYGYSPKIWHDFDRDPGTAMVAVTIVGLAHIGMMFGIRQVVLVLASWLLNRRDQSASAIVESRRFPHLPDGDPVLPLSQFSAEMQRSRG